jgi:hypothetical protein
MATTRAQSPSAETVGGSIPLKEVWANGMRGTRDIQELEREQFKLTGKAFVDAILTSLIDSSRWERDGGSARPAFAVLGKDAEALRGAHAVLVEGQKPKQSFSPDDAVSVVFFAYGFSGRHVSIRNVRRDDTSIAIQYASDRYFERHRSPRIALISIGRLVSGTYRVEIVQRPMDKRFIKLGFETDNSNWSRQFVCQSFSFSVSS